MKNYDDIINLDHPTSKKHPRMSREARASQFAPFAALTGYDDEIKEAGRFTNDVAYLTEDVKTLLDLKLSIISEVENVDVQISYFVPDQKKLGGSYKTVATKVKKIDHFDQKLILANGITIPLKDVYDIDCELFRQMNLNLNNL